MPRVSIVVPFFNAHPFFGEAIESVLSQTFQDWELLLVDDGSRDGSSDLARRLGEEHPGKVRHLHHPGHANRGISASLNLGIREAAGELIALLDADDVWLTGKLEEQVAILESHPDAAMVYGPSQFWYSWTGNVADQPRDWVARLGVPPDRVVEPPHLLVGMLNGSIPAPCPCSVLLRKAAVDAVGGFEERSVPNSHSDQSLYTKLFLEAPVYASGRCWARYRQRADSSVALMKKKGDRDRDRQQLLEWYLGYLGRIRNRDERVRDVLQAELSEVRYRTASRPVRLYRNPARAMRSLLRRSLPPGALDAFRRLRKPGGVAPPGRIRFGDLRRVEPVSRRWGFDRGIPVDRYYIESFVAGRSADIRGQVMEVGDDALTWRYGREAVTGSDVLNVAPGDPKTTLVADLAAGDGLPSDRFDCILFTQTLHFLYDFRAGLRTLHRMLRPGGVLLATFPGISKIGRAEDWGTSWFWGFTPLSARRFFEEAFPGAEITVEAWGNVLSATAFLWGLAAGELEEKELKFADPEYPVIIGVRAVKAVAQ